MSAHACLYSLADFTNAHQFCTVDGDFFFSLISMKHEILFRGETFSDACPSFSPTWESML